MSFKALPTKGLAQKGKQSKGREKSKQRITAAFFVSADEKKLVNQLRFGAGKHQGVFEVKRITTNLTNPSLILATFRTCLFSLFSSFNDEKIKLQVLQ